MREEEIRRKLAKYYIKRRDSILLDVIEGRPDSPEGGIWTEVSVEDLAKLIEIAKAKPSRAEAIKFLRETGWYKKLGEWVREGLIREDDYLPP